MKRLGKIMIAFVLTFAMVFAFAACSAKSGNDGDVSSVPADAVTETAEGGEEDSQNPVMNFIGKYYNGGAYILVEAEGKDGANFTVDWGMTDFSAEQYTFSGTIDMDTLKVTYSNSTKKLLTMDEEGTVIEEKVEYTDGSGVVIFHDDGTLEWQDENESERMIDNETFTFVVPE